MSNKKHLIIGIASVIGIIGLLVYLSSVATKSLNQPDTTSVLPTPTHSSAPVVTHPVASEVFTDVNNERIKAGLPALVEDTRLDASAAAKCDDMVAKNYWAHADPVTGTHSWHFITEQGVYYHTAGENLAYGQHTSQDVVTNWMNSPEHRVNILNSTYSYEGLAVCHSDNFIDRGSQDIVVQHFVGL